jgi:hypothetical protein
LPAQPKKGNVALDNQASWRISVKHFGMPVAIAAIALVLLALPSRAEEVRIPIPAGCRELAERAGIPLALTRAEAARAIAYLRIYVSQDPAVARCRLAIRG